MGIQDIFKAKKQEIEALVAAEKKATDDAGKVAQTAKQMLVKQLEVARQFAEECLKPENKDDYETVFKTETGVALSEVKSENQYVAVVRLFFFPHKDAAKKNGVTINKRATVLHRAAYQASKGGKPVTVEQVLTPFDGNIEKCVTDWRSNPDNAIRKKKTEGATKKDRILKLVKGVAGQPTLPGLAGVTDNEYRVALVRFEKGIPLFVGYVQDDKNEAILSSVLNNVAKQNPGKRGKAPESEQAEVDDNSLGGLLLRITAFAKTAGSDYGLHLVNDGQLIHVNVGKRDTRDSLFGTLAIPARDDVSAKEFVLTNAEIAEAKTILGLSKTVTLTITEDGLIFSTPDDEDSFGELIAGKKGATQHASWIMDEHQITIPLPKANFSLPVLNDAKQPNWLLRGINVDATFLKNVEELEGVINKEMNKGADKRYKFTAEADKFFVRDLAADHSGYIAYEVQVNNGPTDPVDLIYYTGVIPKAIAAIQKFATEKPITLSIASNITKFEADGAVLYVPVMDERDSFRVVNVALWNEKKVVRRPG